MALRAISVCSGIGGLDLGLDYASALGAPAVRPVVYIEREAFAAATLVARMGDKVLHEAPVWSDVATFDARAWRGAVDLVVGGIPCQPHSLAGSRRGTEDERNLWPHFWRIVRESGATVAFLENVPGLRSSGGLGAILEDLAHGGWDAEWLDVSAAQVGAPHRRQRLFVLAYAQGLAERGDPVAGPAVADAVRERPQAGRGAVEQRAGRGQPAAGLGAMADAGGEGRGERGLGRDERPGEHDAARGDDADGRDARALALPYPWPPGRDTPPERWPADCPEPGLRRGVDGASAGLFRADRLRALGNGVVPQQAAAAWCELWRRIA